MRLHVLGRAGADQLAAGLAAFGAEVDDPVGGADHVEVVLDHDQRMAGVEQLAQRAHQLGDVVEVQAGGRLVEQEQRALLGHALRRAAAPPRPGSRPASGAAPRRPTAWAPAGPGARSRGRRRRSAAAARSPRGRRRTARTASLTVRSSTSATLSCAVAADDLHVEQLGAVAAAVAVGAAQVDVATGTASRRARSPSRRRSGSGRRRR